MSYVSRKIHTRQCCCTVCVRTWVVIVTLPGRHGRQCWFHIGPFATRDVTVEIRRVDNSVLRILVAKTRILHVVTNWRYYAIHWYFLRCLWLLYFIRNKLAVNYAAQTDWQSIWNCHVTVAIFDCCCLGFAKSHLGCTLYDWLFCFVQREPFNAVTPIIGCLLILFLQMAQKVRVFGQYLWIYDIYRMCAYYCWE